MQIKQADYPKLSDILSKRLTQYKIDRCLKEEQWMEDLRQYKGIYGPDVHIQNGRSSAYPMITRAKIIGAKARLMEMLFPSTDKNYAIEPSPVPDIPEYELNRIIQGVVQLAQTINVEVTSEMIEKEVNIFAKERARRLEKEVADQLRENGYEFIARQILDSALIYGTGVLYGPYVETKKKRRWVQGFDGQWQAVTKDAFVPYFETDTIWNFYPDLSSKSWESYEGFFRRHIMSRSMVQELGERDDFYTEEISKFLEMNFQGNFIPEWFEVEMSDMASEQSKPSKDERKYQLYEWWGEISGHELEQAGIKVDKVQRTQTFIYNAWLIDDCIIKCDFDDTYKSIKMCHTFEYEKDDSSILGFGVPHIMRHSQKATCSAMRMLLDNASVSTGMMLEVNRSLLIQGYQSEHIKPFTVFERDDDTPNTAGYPAVREVKADGHINELMGIVTFLKGLADEETALPAYSVGDINRGGSEALRTSSGMSQLMGAANVVIRDIVRNFDKFTFSFMTSLINWNHEFNDNPNIKGDYVVVPRGSTSLVAKELRANNLDAMSATITPEEMQHLNKRELLKSKLIVRDLPWETLMTDEDEVAQQEKSAQEALEDQRQQTEAQFIKTLERMDAEKQKILAEAIRAIADSEAKEDGTQIQTYKAIMESLNVARDGTNQKNVRGAEQP